jgi:hypothetical protein
MGMGKVESLSVKTSAAERIREFNNYARQEALQQAVELAVAGEIDANAKDIVVTAQAFYKFLKA